MLQPSVTNTMEINAKIEIPSKEIEIKVNKR
jgi:hypothetical protein